MLCRPLSEGCGSARGVNESDHDAEDNEEHEDTCVAGDGFREAVLDHGVKCADGVKVGDEQCTDKYADEQRAEGLLGDKRKDDCDYRRDQRPEGVYEFHNGFSFLLNKKLSHDAS